MRQVVFAGNWKMNMTVKTGVDLVNSLKDADTKARLLVCPPFTMLDAVCKAAEGSRVMVGAQNMHFEDKGAYTGEVSADMLVELGVTHVILGHSERRMYFAETDETVNKKVQKALSKNLVPIICVGESLEEREQGLALEVITKQLAAALAGVSDGDIEKVIIAYEPIWAIGTGKTATPKDAQTAIHALREKIRDMFKDHGDRVTILYGGSMNGDNVKELMAQPDIDGGLIGGASLSFGKFRQLFL